MKWRTVMNESQRHMHRKLLEKNVVALTSFVPLREWTHCLSVYISLLLYLNIWKKKLICHSNVNSISEWQSGSRGSQSDNWQSSAGRSTCNRDLWCCVLSVSPASQRLDMIYLVLGEQKSACITVTVSLRINACRWTKDMTADGLFRLGSPVT